MYTRRQYAHIPKVWMYIETYQLAKYISEPTQRHKSYGSWVNRLFCWVWLSVESTVIAIGTRLWGEEGKKNFFKAVGKKTFFSLLSEVQLSRDSLEQLDKLHSLTKPQEIIIMEKSKSSILFRSPKSCEHGKKNYERFSAQVMTNNNNNKTEKEN